MKKPNRARMEFTQDDQLGGVLVFDGNWIWMHWPNGRGRYGWEDPDEYEKTQYTSYERETAAEHPSLSHETHHASSGAMGMAIVDPSAFYGRRDPMDAYLDGVQILGEEPVGEEPCEIIEVSYMHHQRTRYLWVSKRDHLPRKLREIVRTEQTFTTEEEWSDVRVDASMADGMFVWTPPEGWHELVRPKPEDHLLKIGAQAPDFDLSVIGGGRIMLSDYRGKAVWLCFWKVGCQPCRREMPRLEALYQKDHAKGLLVLGMNVVDDRKLALDFLRECGATFPCVLDASEAGRKTGLQDYQSGGYFAVPCNYVIDREGKVAAAWYGDELQPGVEALRSLGIE